MLCVTLLFAALTVAAGFSTAPCLKADAYYIKVTKGATCEESGHNTIYDSARCTAALQTQLFAEELFELDVINGPEKPPGCSAARGPYVHLFGNRAYLNTDDDSERIYAPAVGHCTELTPCYCASRMAPLCGRKGSLAYTVVETGTCRSNGYEDFLDMSECTAVLGENFYLGEPFGIHPVSGVLEPPGCWPLAIGFLEVYTASSRAFGFEACIGRNQSEVRDEAFGYCSPRIPCYCKTA